MAKGEIIRNLSATTLTLVLICITLFDHVYSGYLHDIPHTKNRIDNIELFSLEI